MTSSGNFDPEYEKLYLGYKTGFIEKVPTRLILKEIQLYNTL
jgi:hypothetical protein